MDNSPKPSEESLFIAWLSNRETYVGIITVAVEFIVKMMVSTFCAGQMVWLLLARDHPLPSGLGQAFADRGRVTAIVGAVTLSAAVAIVAACRLRPKASGLGLF